jgi:uncharacterized protein YuzE
MSEPIFKYDEPGDTMYITFSEGEFGTGIELNEQILLRVNEKERRAIGITLFDYSILAQPTEIGFRSLPLKGLKDLPPEARELVIEILHSPAVREILSLSAYTPSIAEAIPITCLREAVLERKAA